MAEIFDTLLLLALPASGKSEVRNFLTQKNPDLFHMGPTIQIDDYPYVHFQLLIDEELVKLGQPRIYHLEDDKGGRNGPFIHSFDWPALIQLLNADYHEILTGKPENPEHAAKRLFEKLDASAIAVGGHARLSTLPADILKKLEEALEKDAREVFDAKIKHFPKNRDGHIIVIEFARGGPADANPLPKHYGYAGSLPWLSDELLERAALLYVWVDPEESRRKNRERAVPGADHTILFHGTPESVMYQDYGRDDMIELRDKSDRENTLKLTTPAGKTHYVPISVFDNRKDLTTFCRKDVKDWTEEEIKALDDGIRDAAISLWNQYKASR